MTAANRLASIQHVIVVASGKGGVGKSSVTVQLALSLVQAGYRVGVLDIDLTGPSMPRMLGLEARPVHQSSAGWVPVYADVEQRLACMSIGFLLKARGDSVVWRGPKKNAMIRQFLTDVCWGELDVLVIDTPPGTSDEHISLVEYLTLNAPPAAGLRPRAILVTTPQGLALDDVRRELSFCRKVGLEVLGLIENMSGYVCPHCSECTNIFSSGGGQSLAQRSEIDFLGSLPIDPSFVVITDDAAEAAEASEASGASSRATLGGRSTTLLAKYLKSTSFAIFAKTFDKIMAHLDIGLPNRPFVTLTYAQSLDGYIAGPNNSPIRLSGAESMRMTHQLRLQHDGILVGRGTVESDDPRLTARADVLAGEDALADLVARQPRPIVLDSHGTIDSTKRLFTNALAGEGKAPLIIVGRECTEAAEQRITRAGGLVVRADDPRDWPGLLGLLYRHGIRRLMIEGGAQVIQSALETMDERGQGNGGGAVDRLVVTVAPVMLGQGVRVATDSRDGSTLSLDGLALDHVTSERLGQDMVVTCRRRRKV